MLRPTHVGHPWRLASLIVAVSPLSSSLSDFLRLFVCLPAAAVALTSHRPQETCLQQSGSRCMIVRESPTEPPPHTLPYRPERERLRERGEREREREPATDSALRLGVDRIPLAHLTNATLSRLFHTTRNASPWVRRGHRPKAHVSALFEGPIREAHRHLTLPPSRDLHPENPTQRTRVTTLPNLTRFDLTQKA